jgi:hypothetical protein
MTCPCFKYCWSLGFPKRDSEVGDSNSVNDDGYANNVTDMADGDLYDDNFVQWKERDSNLQFDVPRGRSRISFL